MALAAIALGSWAGGRVADAVDPRGLLGPTLGLSGLVVALTPATLRFVAEGAPALLLAVAGLTILIPGALLSAVTPMVTKLRLRSLATTGTVVGQLSGVGTLGAIAGTVLTGFVFISHVPVSIILLSLGVLLVLAAVPLSWSYRSARRTVAVATVIALAGLALAVAPGSCDEETQYHCVQVVAETDDGAGRTLLLDGVSHSYVDLQDPTALKFAYVRAIASVVDTAYPAGQPLRAYHLGGGGLTFPRYLAEVRPGTESLVSEIDAGVVAVDRRELALDRHPGIETRVEDGRLGVARLATDSRDLVVGDAFGGLSVPWHLTTREALAEVRRVLTPDGVYVMNLIDYGDLDFARAAVATLGEVFPHVAVAGDPVDLGVEQSTQPKGGNLVAVAAADPSTPRRSRPRWTSVTSAGA